MTMKTSFAQRFHDIRSYVRCQYGKEVKSYYVSKDIFLKIKSEVEDSNHHLGFRDYRGMSGELKMFGKPVYIVIDTEPDYIDYSMENGNKLEDLC